MDSATAAQRTILVAVDGSEVAEHAATAAQRLFGDDAQYVRINVGSSDAHLDHTETVSEVGDVATTVVRAAHEHGAKVIVVGSRDRNWFHRLFDPSTSRHVIGASDLPVVVVRAASTAVANLAPADGARLILVATDGSEPSLHSARTAGRLFGPHARYEVVNVVPDRPDPNADASGFAGPLIDDAEADAIYEENVADANLAVETTAREIMAVDVTRTVLVGDAVVSLCEWARQAPADVLVIGSTGLTGLLHVLLGSVSQHVLARCDVPVLVVPHDQHDNHDKE